MRPVGLSISLNSSISSCRDEKLSSSTRRSFLGPPAVTSPPLSPGLPSILSAKNGLKSRKPLPKKTCKQYIFQIAQHLIFLIIIILGILQTFFWLTSFMKISQTLNYDLVESQLPYHPTILLVNDDNGKQKWTMWIPSNTSFPLHPKSYSELCTQVDEVTTQLKSVFNNHKSSYHSIDPNFVDVTEAINTGLIPDSSGSSITINQDQRPICKKSLTFIMETDDTGMGKSLLALWLAYGLAQKQGRTFFVDDSKWMYGNFTSYFEPLPITDCQQPPSNFIIPCPHTTDHLLISQATFPYVFGSSFMSEYSKFNDQSQIYEMIRDGYNNLFKIKDKGDLNYIQQRLNTGALAQAKSRGGLIIGVHIRHGDLHPWQNEFNHDYLPISKYTDAVDDILSLHNQDSKFLSIFNGISSLPFIKSESKQRQGQSQKSNSFKNLSPSAVRSSITLLGTDDPHLYENIELQPIIRAQDRIKLADSKTARPLATSQSSPWYKSRGWEGGFYPAQFFSFGHVEPTHILPARAIYKGRNVQSDLKVNIDHDVWNSKTSTSSHHSQLLQRQQQLLHDDTDRNQKLSPGPEVLALRALIGRSYLLDLAILGKSDAIVCGVSSAACRILGVMMGWEAIHNGKWRNVDGNFDWQGVVF